MLHIWASPVHSDIDTVTILNVGIVLFSCATCNIVKCAVSLIRHSLTELESSSKSQGSSPIHSGRFTHCDCTRERRAANETQWLSWIGLGNVFLLSAQFSSRHSVQHRGQHDSFTSFVCQSISGLCCLSQVYPRMISLLPSPVSVKMVCSACHLYRSM